MTRLIFFTLLLLLVACEAQPTPFPADIPTAVTGLAPQGNRDPIRYALAANTQGLVADLSAIQASSQVEQLTEPINPDDFGVRYDLVAAYGDLPDGIRSPSIVQVALVINSANPPLNNPILLSILKRNVDSQAIIEALSIAGAVAETLESGDSAILRMELANAGWPDGFSLNMAYSYTPGILQLVEQFQAVGIKVQPHPEDTDHIISSLDQNQIQIALVNWVTIEKETLFTNHFGAEQVIDLYTIPISYRAAPELTITFTPDGWPLASR